MTREVNVAGRPIRPEVKVAKVNVIGLSDNLINSIQFEIWLKKSRKCSPGVAVESRLRLARVGLLGKGVVHELLWLSKVASFVFVFGKDFLRLNLDKE